MTEKVQNNPANAAPRRVTEKNRIPMSVPNQKLEVPEIPGYHTHWFVSTTARITQALRAGYEFVEVGEVELNEFGLGTLDGNSDLGTRVTVVGGTASDAKDGENTLTLMKIRDEWREADVRALEDRNDKIVEALRGVGSNGDEDASDSASRYIPKAHKREVAGLFKRKG